MKDFKKGGFGGSRGGNKGGRPNFGGRPSFGGKSGGFRGGRDDRGPRQNFGDRQQTMHSATCSECAKICEVPFRPTGEKPIYCSECFGSKKGANDYGNKRDFAPRQSFKSEAKDNRIDDLKKDIEFMNIKLDRMMRAIESLRIAVPAPKETAKPVASAALKSALKKVVSKKSVKKKVSKKK